MQPGKVAMILAVITYDEPKSQQLQLVYLPSIVTVTSL